MHAGGGVYTLLSDADRRTVRLRLLHANQYFYHGTASSSVAGIRQNGLSPNFESRESSYAGRLYEPSVAMRYCSEKFLELACSAAIARSQVWSEVHGIMIDAPGVHPVMLRTTSTALLNRAFGLDHSFADLNAAVATILTTRKCLTADEFIDLFQRFGAVGCYETIGPEDLQISADDSLSIASGFKPLAEARID